jgi:membrane protein YqaA with SNARE-associated domain
MSDVRPQRGPAEEIDDGAGSEGKSRSSHRAKRWFERFNQSKHLLWVLGTASFLETVIVPIPIEVVLIPLMAANRRRIFALATVTTLGCLVASVVGYGVGMLLFQSVGTWFIETMGYQDAYQSFQALFGRYGFLAILLVGILPIPFQLAMIAAGLSGYPIHLFVLAAVIARGIRYYGLAWLVYRFGDAAQRLWERHALAAALGAAAIVIGVYLVTHYLAAQVM